MGSIASLLDVSRRALNAQTQAIRVIGDNIANVNTPGYAKRNAQLVSEAAVGTSSVAVGTGVNVLSVQRQVDAFINKEQLQRISERASTDVQQQYLVRAETPFELSDTSGNIGHELSNFFASLQDLGNNPSDVALRSQVIQSGNSLTASIRDAYSNLAVLQREADGRVADGVNHINALTSEIATLNAQIASTETPLQQNLTLRDQREQKLRELNDLVPVQIVEQTDHQVQVSLANGFNLVNGTSAMALTYTQTPNGVTGQAALDGGTLGSVVYDYSPGTAGAQVDFSNLIAGGEGTLGGLFKVRGGPGTPTTDPFKATGSLVDIASRVEAMARDLLVRFNQTYQGTADETAGGAFNSNSVDLDGGTPGPYGLFNYTGMVGDGDNSLNGQAGTDDLAASGITNFASRLQFAITDERKIAAGIDQAPLVTGSTPVAEGDSTNIQRVADLRDQTWDYSLTYAVGNFTANSTIEDLYRQTVSHTGGITATAQTNFQTAKAQEVQINELQSNISGVSLDEELAQLINYQRAFQAAAKMITTGDQLLDQILNLLR